MAVLLALFSCAELDEKVHQSVEANENSQIHFGFIERI